MLNIFKQRKKSDLNRDNHVLMAKKCLWAIEGCKQGRTPYDDTCLKCGKCGRFNKKI